MLHMYDELQMQKNIFTQKSILYSYEFVQNIISTYLVPIYYGNSNRKSQSCFFFFRHINNFHKNFMKRSNNFIEMRNCLTVIKPNEDPRCIFAYVL